MKKLLLISLFLISFCTSVIYANDVNQVVLNGEVLTFSIEPIIENETTLVPMRTIFEALGATVTWNSEDKSILAVKNDVNVYLQQDNPIAKINDKEITLTVAPKVISGTTLVPIRFVTETFGGKIDWDGDSKKIIITTIEMKEMVWPVPGNNRISTDYGMHYHPVLKGKKLYAGIGITAEQGTPIVAAADGKVMFAGEYGGYGNAVLIDHGDGIITLYAHCSEITVEEDSEVKAGDEIARIGSTGNSTISGLFFQVRKNGRYVDPNNYVKPEQDSKLEEGTNQEDGEDTVIIEKIY